MKKSNFLTSTTTGTNTPGSNEYFFTDSKSPPHKRVKTRPDTSISVNSREGIATMESSNQYKSPLDLLIEDKQVELEKERKKVESRKLIFVNRDHFATQQK